MSQILLARGQQPKVFDISNQNLSEHRNFQTRNEITHENYHLL